MVLLEEHNYELCQIKLHGLCLDQVIAFGLLSVSWASSPC